MHAHLDFLQRKVAFRARNWFHTISSLSDTPKAANVLLVTVRHELAETQLYPFHFYRDVLTRQHGVRCAQVATRTLMGTEAGNSSALQKYRNIKRIFFQPEYEMPPEQAVQILELLQSTYPNAKIAFMDWFAPLHIRPAIYADPYIDIYIKKQTYADFSNFSQPTLGDTNLNDYYARRHSLPDIQQQFIPPVGFEKKIRLGSNFGLSPQMVDLFLKDPPRAEGRPIDVHARIAVNGVQWYREMRQEAKDAVQALQASSGLNIAAEGRVKRYKFFAEMMQTKICFSPFGYGEVCWRDYEAYATGALLLKPDMSHLRVLPEVFIPYETYVPLQWDLSDFSEKTKEYLSNDTLRSKIAAQAFHSMSEWIGSAKYADQLAALCQ